MIAFKDVQTTAHALLVAAAYLAGEAVILDEGRTHTAIEEALNGRGFAVIVRPIFDARRSDTAGSGIRRTVVLDALFQVDVAINPEKNPEGAGKNIIEAIVNVIRAILAYEPEPPVKNPNDFFSLAGDAVTLLSDSPGEWSYALTFSKTCVV